MKSQGHEEEQDRYGQLDEMLSLMFDDQLDAEQVAELNDLIEHDAEARQRTLETAQMHADLHAYFNQPQAVSPALSLPTMGLGLPANN